jgi:hypothetical protein
VQVAKQVIFCFQNTTFTNVESVAPILWLLKLIHKNAWPNTQPILDLSDYLENWSNSTPSLPFLSLPEWVCFDVFRPSSKSSSYGQRRATDGRAAYSLAGRGGGGGGGIIIFRSCMGCIFPVCPSAPD